VDKLIDDYNVFSSDSFFDGRLKLAVTEALNKYIPKLKAQVMSDFFAQISGNGAG